MKYYILNLGCQMNQTDSERIQAVLDGLGLVKTDNEAEASLLGVVACSVRQKAIDKVYSKIHAWNSRKDRQNLITFVSGCILPADHEKFLDRFDLVFEVSQAEALPRMLAGYGVVSPLSSGVYEAASPSAAPAGFSLKTGSPTPDSPTLDTFWKIKPAYSSAFEAFVPIQNGCDKFCTYCAVPYTRGREVSRPSGEILAEVESLVNRGYKSITLLGQNVNSYGLDKPGTELTFVQLLEKIGQLGDQSGAAFWVYFTSPHPRDMNADVLEVISRYRVLAKQIHLPLQSGDDHVLIRMNRNHSMERYESLITDIRRILPTATVFTDIIVGFTGETNEQFENTRQAVERFNFQMIFIAPYSPRPGAASARWDDDVPLEVKKQRFQALNEVLDRTSLAYCQSLVGQEITVLAEREDRKPGFIGGRTEGRIPVRFRGGPELIGQFVRLKITQGVAYSAEGEVVSSGPELNQIPTPQPTHA